VSEEKFRIDPRWVVLGVAGAVMLVLALWWASLPKTGQEFALQSATHGETLYVPTTLEAAKELDLINRNSDTVSLARVVLVGQVMVVTAGTSVTVTDHSWLRSLYEIQISAGMHAGQRGWVPRQVLAKPNP
jgi:hypothetical protein